MKKTLVLASLLAAFGAASAQSTVTISGTTAFGYQKTYGFGAPAQQTKGVAETDFTFKLSGTEQLGGGLAAVFSMEMDDCGNVKGTTTGASCDGTFRVGIARKNTSIALTGGFGTIGMGNTRSAEVANMAFVGSTNLNDGLYDSQVLKRGAVDVLGFTSNRAAGFQYGIGVSESSSDGNNVTGNRTTSVSANYAMGPLAIAGAYRYSADNKGATVLRHTNFELGATFNAGVAMFGFGIDGKPAGVGAAGAPANAVTGLLASGIQDKMAIVAGVNVPFGSSAIGLNYAKRGDAKIMEVGYQNNLSARTNVNFSVGNATTVGTVAGAKATDTRGQYRVSLNHAF